MPRFPHNSVRIAVVAALLLRSLSAFADDPAEEERFFESKVRPILTQRCLECHGESGKPKGGLDLRLRRLASKVIVPGDPEESPLFARVRDHEMPPGKVKLSAAEANTIRLWIARGARTARPEPEKVTVGVLLTEEERNHWSFQPVRRPAVPPGEHPIDAFLLAALRRDNLTLAPEADRRTLIRRLSFDLIGLPPTPEEVEAFVADKRPDAYERLVDRLLASPHHGERWARHWLDVARYADTKGYVFMEERRYTFAYTYRDYVIRAFNEDLPYDRFILHQLAADKLDLGSDPRPLAAMGFLTLGRRFLNNTHDIIDDRIDVVTRGLMGLTVTCARCHDHKYDPLSQREFYQLYGYFNSVPERGKAIKYGNSPPMIPAPTQEQQQRLAALEQRSKTAERRFEGLQQDLADDVSTATLVALDEQTDPVLADLWNNPKDAAYDKL